MTPLRRLARTPRAPFPIVALVIAASACDGQGPPVAVAPRTIGSSVVVAPANAESASSEEVPQSWRRSKVPDAPRKPPKDLHKGPGAPPSKHPSGAGAVPTLPGL
jgi:hypothetical protein